MRRRTLTGKAAQALAATMLLAGGAAAFAQGAGAPASELARPVTEAECRRQGGWVNEEASAGCNSGRSCALRGRDGVTRKACVSIQGATQGAFQVPPPRPPSPFRP